MAHLHLQRVIDGLVLRVSLHSQDIGNTQSTVRIGVALTCQKRSAAFLAQASASFFRFPEDIKIERYLRAMQEVSVSNAIQRKEKQLLESYAIRSCSQSLGQ